MPSSANHIVVGARESPLSQAQFAEVQQALPHVTLIPKWMKTTGDQNLEISLRQLDKTDFFTKEIDQLLLSGDCQVAVHSAKDLPDPLPKGLCIVALTQGVDARDVLVMKPGIHFEQLPTGAIIATSSERREQTVKALRSDLRFIDLRGTIQKRLQLLETGEADGVVVAEAALIRLKLTHLNRYYLPGDTTPGQGKLAILAREGDVEMQQLFHCLDSRVPCHASFI